MISCRLCAAQVLAPAGLPPLLSLPPLPSADVMAAIVRTKLAEPAVRARGFVLDGYPPSLADAESLAAGGVFPTAVLSLRCAADVAVARQVSDPASPLSPLSLPPGDAQRGDRPGLTARPSPRTIPGDAQ